jgi:serine phosphatase RsbU (regulator of sigma subunit)/anti-sigma regulatory factor (Ser/Thr protein kinase)
MSVENKILFAAQSDHRLSLRVEAACEFSAGRAAVLQLCRWLGEKGLPELELNAWELALVEAVNNAVKYASAAAHQLPVILEISIGAHDVEARITDHTTGFDWPHEVGLPATDAEKGRGLFLIKSLTSYANYFRQGTENILMLRRARPAGTENLTDIGQLEHRLAETESVLADMTAELASSYESLVALFRYSSELGAQLDLENFSQRLLRDLVQIAEADCAVLRLLSADGKKLETLFVLPEKNQAPLPDVPLAANSGSAEIRAARYRQDIWFSPQEPLSATDPLRSVLPVGNGVCHAFFVADQLVGTAMLGRLAAEKPFTSAQVNLLHTFVDFLAIQIVNARLLDERTATRVTRRELEIAAEIQRSLLPEALPACPPFALAAACQSASQVGGDFYDAIPAGDGAVLLVIADVMGKGIPAAFFAAVLRSTIRSMPQFFAQPGELLTAANRILFPDLSRVNMFITAKAVYLDARQGKIISASAGHCPLLVFQSGKADETVRSQTGFPLGIEADVVYAPTSRPLSSGAAVLLYTDGLSETRNENGEMLGEKNLRQMLAKTVAETHAAETGKQFLLGQLAAYRENAPLTDDQTFIFIRHEQ